MKIRPLFILCIFFIGYTSISAKQLGGSSPHSSSAHLPRNALMVPLVRQQTKYSCGAVATLALLRYWRPGQFNAISEYDLFAPLKTNPEEGTHPQPMAHFINHIAGLRAMYRNSHQGIAVVDLEKSIDGGEPVIVCLQAWRDEPHRWITDWIDGHYMVIVGYDAQNFYFMDPSYLGHYTYIPRPEFAQRWHDVIGKRNIHVNHPTIFVHSEKPVINILRPSETIDVKRTL